MKTESNTTEEPLLTEDQVFKTFEFYDFARSLSGTAGLPMTVDLLNQKMKEISLLSTGEVTESNVTDALSNPRDNELELQRQSQAFEITSQIYKRLLNYYGNIPAFDFTYTCVNATEEDYKKQGRTKSYDYSLNIMREFFDSFDHRSEFNKISREMLRNESYFSVFRDEGKKFVFQELPSDKVKITGRWDFGLLFSFDYYYFLQGGVDINMYPTVFKKNLAKLMNDGFGKGGYHPSSSINLRGNRGFAQYLDCSPIDGFWAFKLAPEITTRIPFFVGMFPDLVKENVIRELQNNSYLASATKVIMGQVPFLDAKTKVRDAISISPDLLGKFLSLVQSAINSTAVKVAASPLENVKGFDFKSDPDIRDSYLRTTLNTSGASTNLLFSGTQKPNTVESMLSLAVDEIFMESIYPQFEDFLTYQVNKRIKDAGGTFRFKIHLEGSKFYTDRKERLDRQTTLMDRGIVLPQKIAAAVGMNPFDMERQMEEARAMGWVDKLTPVKQASQMSNKDGGRPKLDDGELSESGSQTREDGGNNEIK